MGKRRQSNSSRPPGPAHAASTPLRGLSRRWLAFLAFVSLGAGLLYFYWSRHRSEDVDLDEDPADDPRLTYTGPFRNVHPDIKYVGDAACAGCHREIHKGFRQHSMGRSITPVADVASLQKYDPAHNNPFRAMDREFRVDRRGDQVVHQEIFTDTQGKTVVETDVPVQYAIGSGTHAFSYLLLRGQHVFQSPITWFTQKQRWDLSPSFEDREDMFTRPMRAECLFCHCNLVEPVKGSVNRYREPLFPVGQAIGCERCHGPGELHVKERSGNLPISDKIDYTIVNPEHLDPPLREAVCQQCHLEGDRRVLRRGRGAFDFRPGLPLHPFYSVFVPPPDLADHGLFVGHFEQMHASKCFTKSHGKMGCVTCHGPHEPVSERKPEVYRNICMNCHQDQRCTLPEPERRAKNQDNCLACHMPKQASRDVRHIAITNHVIPRKPQAPAEREPRRLKPGDVPLVHFHADQINPKDPEIERDLGLALVELVHNAIPLREQLADTAIPYLEASLRRWPHDSAAREGLAFLHNLRGRPQRALETVERVIERSPRREQAFADAAEYADAVGDLDQALHYACRACELNPWIVSWRERLAEVYLQRKDYDQAIAECRQVLTFNPGTVRIRALLAAALVRSGKTPEGEAEFETALKLNPKNINELRLWFNRQRQMR